MQKLLATTVWVLIASWLAAQAPEPTPVKDSKDDKVDKDDKKKKPTYISEVGGRTFDQWKTDLRNPDPSVRAAAIIAILGFGSRAADALPLLLERCLDRDGSPRVKAVIALTLMEIPEKDIPKVIDALARRLDEDTQSIIRYQAAVALDRFADHDSAPRAVGALIKGASDQAAWEIRRICVTCLRRCGVDKMTGPEPRVTSVLMRSLSDPAARVRLEAAFALGSQGRPPDNIVAGQVERALLTVIRDRDKSVALWAQVSLMALADKVTYTQLEKLAEGMQNTEARMRAQTVRALGALGDRAKPVVHLVVAALKDKEKEVVYEACISLAGIGDKGPKVMEALTALSKDKEMEEPLRETAKMALEHLNSPAKPKKN
jgi:HEAT repeat protein